MKLEKQNNSLLFSTTIIPDAFFTEYFTQASGSAIKVYLYLYFLAKYGKDIKTSLITCGTHFGETKQVASTTSSPEPMVLKMRRFIPFHEPIIFQDFRNSYSLKLTNGVAII